MSAATKKPCPYETAGFFSKLTYTWLLPLVLKGRRDGVKEADLFACSREDTAEQLGDDIKKQWDREIGRFLSGKNPSLSRAIIRVFRKPYILASILPLIEECLLKIAQAVFLGYLVHAFGNRSSNEIPIEAYWSAAGVCIATLLSQFTRHPYFTAVRKIGMQVRIACCSLVCKKAMRLSKAAMGETTVGQMVNLISNDVGRFDQSVLYLPYLVIGPIQTCIIVAILWKDLGPSCLAGVSVLLLYIPYQAYTGKVFAKLRSKTAVKTDERICLTSEVVAAMRIIKMYTWEKAFDMLVSCARKLEIRHMRQTSLIQAFNLALCIVFSKIILAICFSFYSYMGNNLTAEKVFVSLSLFNHLRLCMTFFFANGISQLAETRTSIKRLQTFLLLEEQEEMDTVERPSCRPPLSGCFVTVEGLSARWDCLIGNLALKNITAKVKAGEILAVVGPVGSGKTSFLMALLGELQAENGKICVSGNVAYTSQEPWTFSGTIRQNIIFDKPYDAHKFRKVLAACALDKDIEQFPRRDLSLVGDRGASLSGGQRARVSLARSVYADSDIYLLDDPLSAVDAAVGKHLFEKCISGYLRDKVRVLVTHQVQFLKTATNILVLDEGKTVALGNYEALRKCGIDLIRIQDEVVEERRNSVIQPWAGRRKSTVRRGSVMHKNVTNVLPSIPSKEPDNRRKSVILSGLRKSVKLRAEPSFKAPVIQQPDTRKKSVVAALFERGFSSKYKHDKPERSGSIISNSSAKLEEDLRSTASSIEISPYGSMIDSAFSDLDITDGLDDSASAPEESAARGSVGFAMYWKYFRAGGGALYVITFFISLLVRQIGINGSDYWLTLWSSENECNTLRKDDNTTACNSVLMAFESFFESMNFWYVGLLRDGYLVIIAAVLALSFMVSTMFSMLSMRASINLHKWMFHSVIRSKIIFFDENPVGRILNRFSKDIGAVDETLPITLADMLTILLSLLGSVVLVIIINPWIAVPTGILSAIFILLRGAFVGATRDIKRLEAVVRSPVYSTLATTMNGITTIRAFRAQSMFTQQFLTALDNHTASWFAFICISQYFGMALDFLCAIYIAAITWVLVLIPLGSSGGNIGLAISSALVLGGTFQWGVRLSVEVENQMTSVERVLEYSKLPAESDPDSPEDKKPPDTWPQKGGVVFSEVFLQYTPQGKHILRNFSCDIRPEEKVGIVGRTGAGKSSLMAALYRLVEPEGTIYIDGLSTKGLGLTDLRSKISIIPQEPIIFTGSVKRNLDPYDDYPDPEIWNALEQVQLKSVIKALPYGLDCEMSDGGGQLSLGQRQLFCLARVILKKNKILVMDEATANIDHKTDELIQKLIKEVFRECTVLTIAHRLNTIIDYNKILVLDSGIAAEFEDPHLLLQSNGIFTEMAMQTGFQMFRELQTTALKAYRRRNLDYKQIGERNIGEQDKGHPKEMVMISHPALDRALSTINSDFVIEESEEESEDDEKITQHPDGHITKL